MPRYQAILDYQTSFPPVHQMIASYFGIKPKVANDSKTELKLDDNMYELLNLASSNDHERKKTKGIRMI